MKWIEPKGYGHWKYKTSNYHPNKYWLMLSVIVELVCIYLFLNIDLDRSLREGVLLISLLSAMFLSVPFYFFLDSIFNYHRVRIEIGSTYVNRRNMSTQQAANFYLNEIEKLSFQRIKWKGYDFYNCYVKLKNMRASHKDFYQFGIDIQYYEQHKDELIQNLKLKASAQEYLSAPTSH